MLYLIGNKATHWGDWSDILWAGFVPQDEDTEQYYLERSGPFFPQIFIASGSLVFAEAAKVLYEQSGLQGICFGAPLEKRKIVSVDWRSWDTSKDYYDYDEDLIEPEDIIDDYPHDAVLAKMMPDFWRAQVVDSIHISIDRSMRLAKSYENLSFPPQSLKNADFYAGIEYLGFFVSEKGKLWIERNFPDCFDFYPLASS